MTPELVASAIGASADGASATASVNTTGATFIAVSVGWATAGTAPTLTDSQGNVWTKAAAGQTATYVGQVWYYCFAPKTSATHTFNVAGAGSAPYVAVVALSGVPDLGQLGCESSLAVVNQTSLTNQELFGAVIFTGIADIGTAHTISAGWSKQDVNFSSGVVVGGGIGWRIQSPAAVQTPTWGWTGTGNAASTTFALPLYFSRIQATPVIANHNQGGPTIGGVQPDALAAPAACWDGSRWVLTVSIWNTAAGKWYSAFYTSLDLANWTYVPGSLVSPTGTDYIVGNSGLAFFNGKYYWAYSHYPSSNSAVGATLAHSTDLLTWTVVGDPIISTAAAFDPSLVVNPTTGNLEIWATNASREVVFATSADGSAWSGWSAPILSNPSFSSGSFGEPQVWYSNGIQFCTCDTSNEGAGGVYRYTSLFCGPSLLCAFPSVFGADASNPWESVQVFDFCGVGAFDRGDGRGKQLWGLYAGGDNSSATDNTDSSIGLVFMPDPTASSGGALLTKRRRFAA